MPGWARIITIALGTFVVACFGYDFVHYDEMFSWFSCLAVFVLALGEFGEFARSGSFNNIKMDSGFSETVSVLSFAASVIGIARGWTSQASHYSCYQPVGTNRWKIFLCVFAGLLFPSCFAETLCLAIETGTVNDQAYLATQNYDCIGGLLAAVLSSAWGRFG